MKTLFLLSLFSLAAAFSPKAQALDLNLHDLKQGHTADGRACSLDLYVTNGLVTTIDAAVTGVDGYGFSGFDSSTVTNATNLDNYRINNGGIAGASVYLTVVSGKLVSFTYSPELSLANYTCVINN